MDFENVGRRQCVLSMVFVFVYFVFVPFAVIRPTKMFLWVSASERTFDDDDDDFALPNQRDLSDMSRSAVSRIKPRQRQKQSISWQKDKYSNTQIQTQIQTFF